MINTPYMAYKGYFKPINSFKYLGNPTNIIYRSLWEMKLMAYLDKHPDVIGWASEEVCIPYKILCQSVNINFRIFFMFPSCSLDFLPLPVQPP